MSETNKLYRNIANGLGIYGTVLAGPASTSTGEFSRAIFITSGTVSTLTASGIENASVLASGTTLPAGSLFAGDIEKIVVRTGYALLYKKGGEFE